MPNLIIGTILNPNSIRVFKCYGISSILVYLEIDHFIFSYPLKLLKVQRVVQYYNEVTIRMSESAKLYLPNLLYH